MPVVNSYLAFVSVDRETHEWTLLNSLFQLQHLEDPVWVVYIDRQGSLTRFQANCNSWVGFVAGCEQVFEEMNVEQPPVLRVFGAANLVHPFLAEGRRQGLTRCTPSVVDLISLWFPQMMPEAVDRKNFTAQMAAWLTGWSESDYLGLDGLVKFIRTFSHLC